MDVRIGVTDTPKELTLELADDTDRAALEASVEEAVGGQSSVLWLTDKKGRRVAIPAAKVAYVDIGAPDRDRRIGFASA